MNQLTTSYGQECQTEVNAKLEEAHEQRVHEQDVEQALEQEPRTMVLQIDGVYVLEQAQEGICAGLELKTAVLYPLRSAD